jgi:hypothetical protein
MGFRKQDRSLLAHWLKRQKQVMREKEEALEEGKTWFKRAKLAHEKGERELAHKAHQRAADAKRKHDKALRELERIAMELETLRSSASDSPVSDSGAAARAEQITQNFERMGIDTDMAALESLAERADADQALSNLRNRLGGQGDETAEGSHPPPQQSSLGSTEHAENGENEAAPAVSTGQATEEATTQDSSEPTEENKATHRDSGLAGTDEPTEEPSEDGFRLEPLGDEGDED